MAWYSYPLAKAIPFAALQRTDDPRQLLSEDENNAQHFVWGSSRGGVLLWELGRICEISSSGQQLYLLQDACLLQGPDIARCIAQLEALINEISCNPAVVLEATKEKHRATTTILADGFLPLEAQVVYADEARIVDGYVYAYTEAQVRELMDQSFASDSPCTSDDGDQLLDVFNFLKSHLALLKYAAQSGHVIVYAETSE